MLPAIPQKRYFPDFMQNSGCYLNGFSPCHGKLSAEHLVSKVILKQLGERTVHIEGLPWCKDSKEVGINSITSRILCQQHNSSLSDFDAAAGKLFGFLCEVPGRFEKFPYNEQCAVDGRLFEKWLLKTMIGLIASGNATKNGEVVESPLSVEWMQCLTTIIPGRTHQKARRRRR